MIITIVLRWIVGTIVQIIGGILLWSLLCIAWMLCAIFVYPFTKPAIPLRKCEWTPYYVWHPSIINDKLVWNEWIWRTWATDLYYGWDTLSDYGSVAYRLTEPKSKTFPKKIRAGGGGGPNDGVTRPYKDVPYPPEDGQKIVTLESKA